MTKIGWSKNRKEVSDIFVFLICMKIHELNLRCERCLNIVTVFCHFSLEGLLLITRPLHVSLMMMKVITRGWEGVVHSLIIVSPFSLSEFFSLTYRYFVLSLSASISFLLSITVFVLTKSCDNFSLHLSCLEKEKVTPEVELEREWSEKSRESHKPLYLWLLTAFMKR